MKTTIVAAGAALAVQGAFAAGNDLYLSLNNNSGTPSGATEFTVDLGKITSFQSGFNQVDLSSFVSTFNSQYASAGVSGLNFGVAGGINGQGPGGNGVGNDVFTTTLRTSNIGAPATAGSSAPSVNPTKTTISNAGGVMAGVISTGSDLSTADGQSFTHTVAKDPSTAGLNGNNFTGDLGAAVNPLHQMTGTSIVLDLYKDTVTTSGGATTGWVYQGSFTLDLSGSEASLIWDQASAVPEPSTYGLFGGAGVLALALRRQFRRKTA